MFLSCSCAYRSTKLLSMRVTSCYCIFFRLPTFYFIANTACSNLLCDVAVLTNIHIPVQNEWKEQAIVIKGFMIVGFSVSVTSFVYSACDR